MRIKYAKAAPAASYDEYAVTGVRARWQPGQEADVPDDARRNSLLATGLFADIEIGAQEVPLTASPSGAGIPKVGIKSGDSLVSTLPLGELLVQDIPLTHSLICPDGYVVPFTSIGASSVRDCYGVLRYLTRGNTPGFQGARIVENDVTDPSMTTGFTRQARCSAPVLDPNLVGPFEGRKNVYRSDVSANSSLLWVLNSAAYRLRQRTFSLSVMGDGATEFILKLVRSSDSTVISTSTCTPPAGVMTRLAVYGTPLDGTNHKIELHGPTNSFAFAFSCPQWEETHGQTGAPNDYVPRGYASDAAPWRGCGVDGVQSFDTYNPWAIAATTGLCTKSESALRIPADVMKGLRTGFSHANKWRSTKDLTGADTVLTNAVAGAYMDSTLLGVSSLQLLEETTATGEHKFGKPWNGTAAGNSDWITVAANVVMNRKFCYLWIIDKDGVETRAYFDLRKGKVTSCTNTTTVLGDPAFQADIERDSDTWKISYTVKAGTGATNPTAGIGACSVADTPSYAGTAANGIYVGALSFEKACCPTLYLGDVGTSAPSGTGDATAYFDLSSLIGANDFTLTCELTTQGNTRRWTRTAWDGVVYSKVDNDHRLGLCLRPGPAGGGVVEDYRAGPVLDVYSGRSTSQEVFSVMAAADDADGGNTQLWQWSICPDAVNGTDGNHVARVGNTPMLVDSNAKNIVDVVPPNSRWAVGSIGTGATPITEKFIKNVRVYRGARTQAQMAAALIKI